MSRIGQQPIAIPEGVKVSQDENKIKVSSAKGELSQDLPDAVKVDVKDNVITVTVKSDSKENKSLHGLFRSLINNMIIGVTEGFSKTVELQGTGFRVNPKDKGIELSLGFSHPVIFNAPESVKLEVKEQKFVTISGADKQLVGQAAANIRKLRPPDPYKGKGVRYKGEVIKLKPGKAAKATEE